MDQSAGCAAPVADPFGDRSRCPCKRDPPRSCCCAASKAERGWLRWAGRTVAFHEQERVSRCPAGAQVRAVDEPGSRGPYKSRQFPAGRRSFSSAGE
jgi:hypothetical protein